MFAVERYLSGSNRCKNDIVHFEWDLSHAFDAVLDTGSDAVHNVEIDFERTA